MGHLFFPEKYFLTAIIFLKTWESVNNFRSDQIYQTNKRIEFQNFETHKHNPSTHTCVCVCVCVWNLNSVPKNTLTQRNIFITESSTQLYIYIYIYNQVVLIAWFHLTLSCHPSQSSISLSKSSRWHPVSTQN